MSKTAVSRIWIAGAVAMAAGFLAAGIGLILMLAYGGTWTQAAGGTNYEFAPGFNSQFWAGVVVLCTGGVIALAGWVAQIIGWVGGMTNAYRLPEKTWFTILLVGGLVGFFFAPIGFAAVVAYIIAAPDGLAYERGRTPTAGVAIPA